MKKVADMGNRRGRTPKPLHERRMHKVSLRLTMAELALFSEAARMAEPPCDLAPMVIHLAKRGLERREA